MVRRRYAGPCVFAGPEPGRRRRGGDHRDGRRAKGQGTVAVRVGHPVVLRAGQHARPVLVLRRAGLQHRVLGHQPVRAGHRAGGLRTGRLVLRARHVQQQRHRGARDNGRATVVHHRRRRLDRRPDRHGHNSRTDRLAPRTGDDRTCPVVVGEYSLSFPPLTSPVIVIVTRSLSFW